MNPPFPDNSPPENQTVNISLANGTTLPAYWDGTQWWAGLNDDPNDVPIANSFVVSWEFPE
jgi:hypothetical protein